MAKHPHTCDTCPTRGECVHAFGFYWRVKSNGGKGCAHPFSYARDLPKPPRQRPQLYADNTKGINP